MKQHNKLSNNVFVFDKVGKLVSVVFFIIPGITYISSYLIPYVAEDLIKFLIYITLVAGIYSSYLRIKGCFRLISLNTSKCMD